MTLPERQPDFIRNLCIALAHRFEPERLFLILTAYFDESGTHAGSPATILSGVMGTANQWARFQADVDKIKKRYGFKIFHAKELKSRSGEFAGWQYEKGRDLLNDLMLPSSKLMEAITVVLPNDTYEEFYRGGDNPRRLRLDSMYGLCFRYALLNFVHQAMKRLGNHKKFTETRLNVVMEGGHKNAGDAERVFSEMRKELSDLGLDLLQGISFAGKEGCDPIMIADYLASGGLAMERAGAHDRPRPDETPDLKQTGITVLKMQPEHLTELKADLIYQLKTVGKAKFFGGPHPPPKSSSKEQSS